MSSLATSIAMTRLLALAIAQAFSRPAAVSMFGTRSTPPPVACSSARAWSGATTFGIRTMSGRPCITAARSSRPQDSSGLTRTAATAPAFRQESNKSAARILAFGRKSGGVKSSSSWMITSAPDRAAAACATGSAPGTNSQLRLFTGAQFFARLGKRFRARRVIHISTFALGIDVEHDARPAVQGQQIALQFGAGIAARREFLVARLLLLGRRLRALDLPLAEIRLPLLHILAFAPNAAAERRARADIDLAALAAR